MKGQICCSTKAAARIVTTVVATKETAKFFAYRPSAILIMSAPNTLDKYVRGGENKSQRCKSPNAVEMLDGLAALGILHVD